MTERVFTKDTMLDLVVNIIPMGIIAFFIGLFLVWGPFSWDPLFSTLAIGIKLVAFVSLLLLTYVSAIYIERDAMKSGEAGRLAHASEKEDVEDTSKVANVDTPEDTPDATGDTDLDRQESAGEAGERDEVR